MSYSDFTLHQTLSLNPTPTTPPTDNSPHILIIGGGVTGLVTAWTLLDTGHRVTVISSSWPTYTAEQRLTSQIAGALWEYPPAVCGSHTDTLSLRKSKKWCMVAYHIWAAMAADDRVSRESGVRMTNSTFFFPYMLESNAKQMNKFYEMRRAGVRGLRRDVGLISGAGVGPEYGAVDAYELCVPCIDTDACMSFLLSLVRSKGCALITHTVSGDLFYQEQALREAFSADVIVNCSGLASLELASDKSCYPLRGALLRVINDGRDFPKVESALAVAKDVGGDGEIVFIVPRNDNILLLGGIAQKGEWELDLKVDSDTVKRMRERCEKFLPALKNARLDEEYPLAQGLRPCRVRNVRVERELRVHYAGLGRHGRGIPSRIVHNYGHGGAGWSLSFGCAEEVAGLVQEALRDMDAKPMGSEEFVVRSRL